MYAFFKCGTKNDYVRIIPKESKCYLIPESTLRENVLCAIEYNDEKLLPYLTKWAMSDTGIDEEYKEEIKFNEQSVVIKRIQLTQQSSLFNNIDGLEYGVGKFYDENNKVAFYI